MRVTGLYGQSVIIGKTDDLSAGCLILFIDQKLRKHSNQTWGLLNRKLEDHLIGIDDILTAKQ